MADYISSLTGAQMDTALMDMAQHTSEAWAVGQRNGADVASTDLTYHNNAKYYAEQAARVVPTTGTPAVRYDTAQVLTETEQATARNNIGAERTGIASNPNLLDNGWFTVNQRGASSYGANVYTVDRWKNTVSTSSNVLFSVTSDGIKVETRDDGEVDFTQKFEDDSKILNKTITVSAIIDGNLYTWTTEYNGRLYKRIIDSTNGLVDLRVDSSQHLFEFVFRNTNSTHTVKAVKLELGSVSTLQNDNAPCYSEELAKCQRYFYRWKAQTTYSPVGIGIATSSSLIECVLPLPVSMRTINFNSITSSGTLRCQKGDASYTTTSITSTQASENAIILKFGVSGASTGSAYICQAYNDTSAKIDISADL